MNHSMTMREKHAARQEHAASGDPHDDHDRHEGHSVAMFRDKCWLSLLLTIPVLILSPDIEAWFGYTAPSYALAELLPDTLQPSPSPA